MELGCELGSCSILWHCMTDTSCVYDKYIDNTIVKC